MSPIPDRGRWDSPNGDPSSSDEAARTAELVAIAGLRHPHLIRMRPAPGGPGLQPDIAGGQTLRELCGPGAAFGALPLRFSLRILLDTLSGLSALHAAKLDGQALGFVHGEVAPSHIIVGLDGVTRLVPLVRAHWGEAPSTPAELGGYVAPEKLLGDAFDQRADVFSAGVLLWEAIMIKPLFRDLPVDGVITQLFGRKVPRPLLAAALWSAPLADVVMCALSVDPAERWPHVGAMGAQIESVAAGHIADAAEVAGFLMRDPVETRGSISDAVTPLRRRQRTSSSPPSSSGPRPSPNARIGGSRASAAPGVSSTLAMGTFAGKGELAGVERSRPSQPHTSSRSPSSRSASVRAPSARPQGRAGRGLTLAGIAIAAVLAFGGVAMYLFGRRVSTATATVLVPAPAPAGRLTSPIEPPGHGPGESAGAARATPPFAPPGPGSARAPRVEPPASLGDAAKGPSPRGAKPGAHPTPRGAARTAAPSADDTYPPLDSPSASDVYPPLVDTPAAPAAPPAASAPREDPFGLSPGDKPKSKDDPFGL